MDHEHAIAEPESDVVSRDDASSVGLGSRTRLGDFTLVRLLGRGAQGEVYEARQESLGRLVALKLLPPYLTFNLERVQRFRREAEAGGRLDHPNTVGVHSVGQCEGYHYIAQELVAGGRTLGDRIAQARREAELPRDWYRTVAELFVQVADALHAAHEAGIIHRDIKPGNILIAKDGQPKVADFGLAMVLDDLHRSRSGELIGTPFYMSPEQATGSRTGLDRRTDVFSLGATLYESLTLQRPFDGETRDKVVEQILSKDPPDARRLRPSVPRDLAVICMQALEKRRERRYQSALEFADELRRHLASEPIRTTPPGPVVRAGKWLRRHPVRTGFAAAFALVAGLLVNAYFQDVELKARLDYSNAREADLKAFATIAVRDLFESLADIESPQAPPDPSSPILARIDSVIEQAALLERHPEEQAYLLTVAGASLRDVSLFDRAGDCFERALEAVARMDATDPDVPEVRAKVLHQLARLRRFTGDYVKAEALAAESHEVLAEVHGADCEEAFAATKVEAAALFDQGRLDEAELLLRGVIASVPEGSGIALVACRELGFMLMDARRLDEAVALLGPAYERAKAVFPPVEAAQFGAGLAQLHDRVGRAAAATDPVRAQAEDATAEQLFVESIALLREQRPDPSVRTAEALADFGSFLSARQRYPEAREVLEEAVRMGLLALGPDHRVTLKALNNRAVLDNREGRAAEAESGWREIVASCRRIAPSDTRPFMSALKNLATLCFNQTRLPEAKAFATELVERTPRGHLDFEERRQLLDLIEARLAGVAANPPK